MADIDRKFLRLEGVQHLAGCADALGHPCTCGAELHHALELTNAGIEDEVDGVPEDVELGAPNEEWPVNLTAAAIRAVRQALANQRARVP